jgi:hypothetical protein
MNFFRSMEIDPTCKFSPPQSRSGAISFYVVLCTSTFSRNQDPWPTLPGIAREAAEVDDLKNLIERVRLHAGYPGKGMVHRQDREQHE